MAYTRYLDLRPLDHLVLARRGLQRAHDRRRHRGRGARATRRRGQRALLRLLRRATRRSAASSRAAEDTAPSGAPVVVAARIAASGNRRVRRPRRARRQPLQVGSVMCTIIGVAPAGVHRRRRCAASRRCSCRSPRSPASMRRCQQPRSTRPATSWGLDGSMMVRRKPGVSVTVARVGRRSPRRSHAAGTPSARIAEPDAPPAARSRARRGVRRRRAPRRRPDPGSRHARPSGLPASRSSCCSSPARTSRTCSLAARSRAGARSRCDSRSG